MNDKYYRIYECCGGGCYKTTVCIEHKPNLGALGAKRLSANHKIKSKDQAIAILKSHCNIVYRLFGQSDDKYSFILFELGVGTKSRPVAINNSRGEVIEL